MCAAPDRTGVSTELAAQIHAALAAVGAEGLLSYNPPLTYLDAITLMGMEFEGTEGEFGSDFLFEDRQGQKVRCTKNVRNRPLHMSTVEPRVQDILNRRFKLNGETGIIGRDGVVLDFQHTLVALYLAWQDWLLAKDATTGERKWLGQWPEVEPHVGEDDVVEGNYDGPTIDKIVVYGIENSDEVVNTINTGRPRSLSDVLYRCPYFAKLPARNPETNVDRQSAARVTASAVGVVWQRTGMAMSAFSRLRTHSEAVAWIENHGGNRSKLLEAVRFVLEQNKDGCITEHVQLGYAAAMLYLMGCSDTDERKVGRYYAADERTGKGLVWSAWDRACQFWQHFGEAAGPLSTLTSVLEGLSGDREDGGSRNREKDYAVVCAWGAFNEDAGSVTRDVCKVRYTPIDTRTGRRYLKWPTADHTVGGIDVGMDFVPTDPDEGGTMGVQEPLVVGSDPEPETVVPKDANPPGPTVRPAKAPPPTDEQITTSARDTMELFLATVHREHPDLGPVFVKTATGAWAVWGDVETGMVAPYTTKVPRMHPRGMVNLTFKGDEVETVVEALTDAGITVGFVTEGYGGEPYAVDRVCRPAKRKGGKS